MGLSRLSKTCQACPYVDTCDHKRMEALGYLSLPEINTVEIDPVYEFKTAVTEWPLISPKEIISDILRLRDGWMKKGGEG